MNSLSKGNGRTQPDFALLKIREAPNRFPVTLSENVLSNGTDAPILMLHHPGGEPLEISEPGCITQAGEHDMDHTIELEKGLPVRPFSMTDGS